MFGDEPSQGHEFAEFRHAITPYDTGLLSARTAVLNDFVDLIIQ